MQNELRAAQRTLCDRTRVNRRLIAVADTTRNRVCSPRGATSIRGSSFGSTPPRGRRLGAERLRALDPSGPSSGGRLVAIGARRPGDVHGLTRQPIATGTFVPRQTVKGVVEPDTATAPVADHHTIAPGSRKQAVRRSSARVLQSLALVTHECRTRREAAP